MGQRCPAHISESVGEPAGGPRPCLEDNLSGLSPASPERSGLGLISNGGLIPAPEPRVPGTRTHAHHQPRPPIYELGRALFTAHVGTGVGDTGWATQGNESPGGLEKEAEGPSGAASSGLAARLRSGRASTITQHLLRSFPSTPTTGQVGWAFGPLTRGQLSAMTLSGTSALQLQQHRPGLPTAGPLSPRVTLKKGLPPLRLPLVSKAELLLHGPLSPTVGAQTPGVSRSCDFGHVTRPFRARQLICKMNALSWLGKALGGTRGEGGQVSALRTQGQ